jgi:predicted NAD/FAD-binding protein
MPFENAPAPRRIAVIGGGISGLGAAHYLAANHHVTLIEAEPRLGGHARTILAGRNGDRAVDTGFIVFNRQTYPRLVALFEDLGVPIVASDMSFGASLQGGRIEYGLRDLSALAAQPGNLARPAFLRMIRDIFRFNARALAAATPEMTVRDLLAALGTGAWFRDCYLLPLSGAIWSMPKERILDFPAAAMVRFFENHALLNHANQHRWLTVEGGSRVYVERLAQRLRQAAVSIRMGAPVSGIRRDAGGVCVRCAGGGWERFDEVVLAVHSDLALALLSDATTVERTALAAIRYQSNEAVLHADENLMPRRRRVWSSWNYAEPAGRRGERIDLTYWMNSLQPIPKDDPLFVTLNTTRPIRAELIHDSVTFHHPVFDLAALAAQDVIAAINGTNHTWFCGAWMRNGFHEDGLASAAIVAEAMGAWMAPARAAR